MAHFPGPLCGCLKSTVFEAGQSRGSSWWSISVIVRKMLVTWAIAVEWQMVRLGPICTSFNDRDICKICY